MSRTGDEEGFHPHPGDPWHPGWGADEEDESGSVVPPDDTDAAEAELRRRGRFGRRRRREKGDAESTVQEPQEPPQIEEAGLSDEDWDAGPSGWEPDDAHTAWTDDGIVSAEFESAFTVGGDLDLDESAARDSAMTAAESEPVPLPEASGMAAPGAVAELAGHAEAGAAAETAEADVEHEPDGAESLHEEGPLEVGVEDEGLEATAASALAALGALDDAGDVEEPVEVAAEGLGAVEVEEPPPGADEGVQDTFLMPESEAEMLLSAEEAWEQHGVGEEPAEEPDGVWLSPAEEEDEDQREWLETSADEEAPVLAEDLSQEGLGSARSDEAELPPPLVPGPADGWHAVPDEDEVAERLAELPAAEMPLEDLSALTALEEEADDLEAWQAFAEGEGESDDRDGVTEAAATIAAADTLTSGGDVVATGEGYGSAPPQREEYLDADAEHDEITEALPPPLAPPADNDLFDDAFAAEEMVEELEVPKRRGWRLLGRRRRQDADEPEEIDEASPYEAIGEETVEMDAPVWEAETEATDVPLRDDAGPDVGSSAVEPAEEDGGPRAAAGMMEAHLEPEGDADLDVEEEPGEYLGDASATPEGWDAPVDEDDVLVPPMVSADTDWEEDESGEGGFPPETPVFEAGEMLLVDDILEPFPSAAEAADFAGGTGRAEEPTDALPDVEGSVPVPPADLEAASAAFADEEAFAEVDADDVAPFVLWDPASAGTSGWPSDREEGESGAEVEGARELGAGAGLPGDAPEDVVPWEPGADDEVELPEDLPAPAHSAAPWEVPAADQIGAVPDDAAPADPGEPDPGSVPLEEPATSPGSAEEAASEEAGFGPIGDEPLAPAAGEDWLGDERETGDEDWTDETYVGSVTAEHRGLADAIAAASTQETELQALSAAMPGLETGVVGFEDVEDLGTDEEYVPQAPSDFGMRVVTGLTLVALLLGSLWAGGGVLAVFIGVLVVLGLAEYYTTLRRRGYAPVAMFGYLGGIGSLVGTWFAGPIAIAGAVTATAAVVFFFYAFAPQRRDALTNGALTVFGVVWIGATASFAVSIAGAADYRVLMLAMVAATVAMDVGAYGFGRAWGSAQLAPILSPNKSIEGLAGGVVMAIGVALAVGYLMDPFDIRSGAALGLIVAVLAPLGDLAESMFKRSLGVKDMGTILPGHGGILDRVDALLFVLPAAWVLYQTLGYLS